MLARICIRDTGIASAFGAPVGGLLFAMEEVSSFWKNKLSWQVFFCCMVATFTTDLLNSSFHGFRYKGDFGLFRTKFTSKDLGRPDSVLLTISFKPRNF